MYQLSSPTVLLHLFLTLSRVNCRLEPSHKIDKTMPAVMNQILKTILDKKDHIPAVTTNDTFPFPFEVLR